MWKDNPALWPELEYPEVYDYLINTPGVYTKEAMKSRKSLEAHNQFVSGWFGVVKVIQTEEIIYPLTATVLHSQALSEDPLQPWVALQKFGSLMCAHCITAWQGECNLLFVYFLFQTMFLFTVL